MTETLFPSSLLAPLFSSAAMREALDDRARVQRMLDFESALARAEAAIGIIPASSVNAIVDACKADRYNLAALGEAAMGAGNPASPLVKALTDEVAKRSQKAAGFVHWGATSQDVIDTATVLELRAVIDALFVDLDRATKAFVALAGRHRRNMTVARTLLQHALPMPFGFKVAGYAAALARSRDRLRRLRKENLVLQFGGAAGTLAALGDKGLDVSERLAALLDLTMPDAPWHSHRDRLAEVGAALAILAGTCGKIARDVTLMMQSEVGEVAESAEPGSGMSLTVPQKRNPTTAASALSAASIAPNLAASLLAGQIQEHERSVGAWQAEWATFPALALVTSGALSAIAAIAEGLQVDVERMKTNLEATGGLVLAEAVSFALAQKIGRAKAHELIAELSQRAIEAKRAFKDVLKESDALKEHLDGAELQRLLTPSYYQGSAQTFIDRLVATAQGRATRRTFGPVSTPKMPAVTPMAAPAAAAEAAVAVEPTPAVVEAATATAALPPAVAEPTPAAAQPPSSFEPSARVEAEPSPALPTASVGAEPAPVAEQSLPAVTEKPAAPEEPAAEPPSAATSMPPADAGPQETAADSPEPTSTQSRPTVEAPPTRPEDDEPGALLEVFARMEEFSKAVDDDARPDSEAAPPAPGRQHKPASP